jgi:hypothetical protein
MFLLSKKAQPSLLFSTDPIVLLRLALLIQGPIPVLFVCFGEL